MQDDVPAAEDLRVTAPRTHRARALLPVALAGASLAATAVSLYTPARPAAMLTACGLATVAPLVGIATIPVALFEFSLGAYLLVRLGWGVLTFNDVPEAHDELMSEIEVAKGELRKLGVTVD